ncbi:hypothetical protein SOVF_091030 [Spinacia oleracea]|nr:hypothetical protein SOVF_091030 [Spinacia oleracea]
MSSELDSENELSGVGYDDADLASASEDVNVEDDDRPSTSDYFEPSYRDAAFELRAHVRNQVRADIRRDLNILDNSETLPAVDFPSISLGYELRSWTQFLDPAGKGYGDYGTNFGNVVVSFNQDVVKGAHLENVAGGSRQMDGGEVSSRAHDADDSAGSDGEEDEDIGDSVLESDDDLNLLWDDGEDVTSLCEQVVREGDLDEEPDSDTEEMRFRVECPPPAGSAVGLHTLDFGILGLGTDGRPTTNNPPNPKGVFSTLSSYATKANKKRGSSREEPVSASPAKKTKRLSSLPAPKPLTIREPIVASTGGWTVEVIPPKTFGTTSTAGISEMAGGFKSLDCGRGATLAGRRPRDRNHPFNRSTRSRHNESAQPDSEKPRDKTPEKELGLGAEINVAGQGDDAAGNVETNAQPEMMVVDLMTPSRQNQEQEVNDTDAAGMGQKTPPVLPPPFVHTSSGYIRPGQSAGTSSGLNMGVFVRPGEWIEKTPVPLTPRKMKYFEVPPGEPNEPWKPEIDLLRGESVLTDDCKGGGCMGWRTLKNLATPRDNPAAEVDAPAAQHMNDMLKACNSAVELVKLYLCYQEQNEDLQKRQADLEKQVNDAKHDLDQKSSELKRVKQRNKELENVANKLEAAETKNKELSEKLLEADEKAKAAYKTGARDGALRFSRSQTYSKRITDSHNGGWFAAHRCGVHGIGLTKEDYEDIEYAFLVEEKHRVPTGWESQIIPEEIIQNADPLTLPPIELKEEDYLDPAILSSSTNQTDHPQG